MATTLNAITSAGGGFAVTGDASGELAFQSAGTTYMTLNSSGNVGIGTGSPSTILNAYNATSAIISVDGDSTAQLRASRYSNDINGGQLILRKARGTLASPAAASTGDSSSAISFQAYGGTNFRVLAQVSASVENYTSDDNIAGALSFFTRATGAGSTVTEKMRVTAAGNFAVGRTSVSGFWGSTATDAKTVISYSSSDTTFDTSTKCLALLNTDTTTNNTTSLIFSTANTNGTAISQAAIYSINGTRGAGFNSGQLGFAYTNSSGVLTEAMRIDASGYVGIGTSSPVERLNVENGSLAVGYSTANNKISVFNGDVTNRPRVQMSMSGTTGIIETFRNAGTVPPLTFGVDGTERMRIDSSGNVLVTGAGGLGYGTGSGGTVTQATSRTTAVTLNKPTGQITMFTAAGTATWASFVVNNSLVAANDTIVLSVNGATNSYLMFPFSVSAGQFSIMFSSVGGTASDTPKVNFSIIKGATS